MTQLDRADYEALMDARLRAPKELRTALGSRQRRAVVRGDGNLLLVAADHTARGMLAVGDDPMAVADRYTLLDRLVTALSMPEVDGVLASADILEELAYLGALNDRLAIGTMNRGGIIGADWELDDRLTAYDSDHVEEFGLDGGKLLLRIEDTDAGVASTIEMAATIVTELSDRGIMCLVEPLPYLKDAAGRARLDTSLDKLVKVVAVASGLGSSSAYTWLKLPAVAEMDVVAGATSMPILMLGGDPGQNAPAVFDLWRKAMVQPNVRGLVAGRALLYPQDADVTSAVRSASAFVHPEGDRS
ncbi:MAG: aldolase [Actinomycetota bacterium]|jgi:DhnA family fructose-bisphosphate aldolase class Ia|nr:aldolase [Actinomycetota bacterium]